MNGETFKRGLELCWGEFPCPDVRCLLMYHEMSPFGLYQQPHGFRWCVSMMGPEWVANKLTRAQGSSGWSWRWVWKFGHCPICDPRGARRMPQIRLANVAAGADSLSGFNGELMDGFPFEYCLVQSFEKTNQVSVAASGNKHAYPIHRTS